MSDAERARLLATRFARTHEQDDCADLIGRVLAAARAEATAAAEQRIAALEAEVERLRGDCHAYAQTMLRIEEAGRAEAKEMVATNKRAEAAEKERDEARAALEATEDETALAEHAKREE